MKVKKGCNNRKERHKSKYAAITQNRYDVLIDTMKEVEKDKETSTSNRNILGKESIPSMNVSHLNTK